MTRPRISIIVAYAANRVIGTQGRMPWHLPEDLKRFRQLTMGHHIVMGRKTWESIGRLLPGRHHVIVSRQGDFAVPGAIVAHSFEAAIAACKNDSEVFVIGGGEIYREALAIADRIYATEIKGEYEGSVLFPEFNGTKWRVVSRESHESRASQLRFDFVTLERLRSGS
jgi:dihydrofolate reductase